MNEDNNKKAVINKTRVKRRNFFKKIVWKKKVLQICFKKLQNSKWMEIKTKRIVINRADIK